MPTFFTGLACAAVIALGAALAYNFLGFTVTQQTATDAVHVQQHPMAEKAHAAKESRKKG